MIANASVADYEGVMLVTRDETLTTGRGASEQRDSKGHGAEGSATKSSPEKLGQPRESFIKHVIAVMSGKGGVGKSSVTALIAAELAREGYTVGILDADITGPSIPRLFGVKGIPAVLDSYMLPEIGPLGIRIMSINLLLDKEDDPVVWRGPLVAGAVRQFWTDVIWGELDYLIVDLPPGTGDAPLTVLQSLPVDGIVIASTPQDLSLLIVKKAVNMARMLNVPILGLVVNMAWMTCPHCGERIEPFGGADAEAAAQELGLRLIGSLPLDPRLSMLGDQGQIHQYRAEFLAGISRITESSASTD